MEPKRNREQLFTELNEIGKIAGDMASYFQNDTPISEEDIENYLEISRIIFKKINELQTDGFYYLSNKRFNK